MGFEDDVFISYAHVDNETLAAGQDGWVSLLHERLRKRLRQLLGEEVKIWRDPKLQGNDEFADTLVIRVSKAGVLLSVLSPRYVKSDWCRKELSHFCHEADRGVGLTIDNKSRVFNVVKTHIPRERHPPELGGSLGYEFYEYDEATGRAREFRADLDDRRYWDKFEDLAQDISQQLIHLRSLSSAANPAAETGATGSNGRQNGHKANGHEKAVIYLAETTADLTLERDRIRRELSQFGYQVVPDKELPLQGPKLIETVNEYLLKARLSVHLIGAHYGIVPELEDRSIVRIQHDLAMAHSDNPQFKRLIWLPSDLNPKEDRQRAFIEYLSNSPVALNNAELLREKLEDLKTVIQSQLASLQTKPAQEKTDAGHTYIYLICEQRDFEAIQPLYQHLYESGSEVMLPAAGENAIEENQQNLRDCDALLIYFGHGSERWLRTQFSEISKVVDRAKPMLAKAVYVASPRSQPKELFMTREAIVIKNFGDFHPDSLAAFLQKIREAKGAAQ
jgi:hypothetical protein